jgi:Aspartyl protease/PDZ domain
MAQTKTVPNASAILRRMYVASGGSQWDKMTGANLTGDYDLGGLKGTFNQLIDFKHGSDVLAYDVGTTRGTQGTRQTTSWWKDEKGLTTVQDAPDALADAATQSYEDRNGWFYADRLTPVTSLGERTEGGRSFDLIRVQPPRARALTLWIDGTTHLLDRMVELDAAQRENTTYFSDYRQIDGILYPFVQRSSTGDPSDDVIMYVKSFEVRPALTDRDFTPPPSMVQDAHLLTDGLPATIPFILKGGRIVVNVSIDGENPLPFVLDSGFSNVLTPEAAKKLHVSMKGTLSGNGVGNSQVDVHLADIQRYSVGPAELSDQQFAIVPLPRFLTNNGKQEPVAGLIGYEIFRRFVVGIDYYRRELTLSLPTDKPQDIRGEKLPLLFNSRFCYVKASIDGVPGYFGIDTGDEAAITLFKSFYTAHHFPVELPVIKGFQGGIGGTSSTLLTRVASLSLGHFTLMRPLTELHFATGGAFASTLLAGNLGAQVFRNFIMTFDYPHEAVYIRKSPEFGYAMSYNRTGVHLDLTDSGKIVIKAVNEGSPAASAGLQRGDQLVAIDHRSVEGQAYSTVEDWFAPLAGQSLDVEIMRSGHKQHIAINAKELLPMGGPLHRLPDPDL